MKLLKVLVLLFALMVACPSTQAQEVVYPVTPVAAPEFAPLSLAGCWSGSWLSCTTGHKGPMQATFCQICPTSTKSPSGAGSSSSFRFATQ